MNKNHIKVIDQTIREGMQFQGLMLSLEERKKLVDFQEFLGVDVSQVAYPSAHESEKEILKSLNQYVMKQGYRIRVAGLGRALKHDVDDISAGGGRDIHLTVVVNTSQNHELNQHEVDFSSMKTAIDHARSKVKNACIGVSILDIGKTPLDILKQYVNVLAGDLHVDILTLPDTSGVMPPNLFYDRIHELVEMIRGCNTHISVHCHNDMGMATANTVLGVAAGARIIEATALGIGERNGLGDIFLAGKLLKDQGVKMNLKVEDVEGFKAYYAYVNQLCIEKINTSLWNDRTPFFGRSISTHVAGTHGKNPFGLESGRDDWFLNVLCGRHLVKKYLDKHGIDYDPDKLPEIVREIKDRSVVLGRNLRQEDVESVLNNALK